MAGGPSVSRISNIAQLLPLSPKHAHAHKHSHANNHQHRSLPTASTPAHPPPTHPAIGRLINLPSRRCAWSADADDAAFPGHRRRKCRIPDNTQVKGDTQGIGWEDGPPTSPQSSQRSPERANLSIYKIQVTRPACCEGSRALWATSPIPPVHSSDLMRLKRIDPMRRLELRAAKGVNGAPLLARVAKLHIYKFCNSRSRHRGRSVRGSPRRAYPIPWG